jgi:hypothetical protein
MHNLVVIGKNGKDYLISDPVFPEPEICPRRDLIKARFAKGALAPKGTMYFFTNVPNQVDQPKAIRKGIREVCRRMLNTPGPVIGVRGIRFLANRIENWPQKLGERKAALYVGQLIRMQEEIGTGGAGFRFMYSAFLQEASEILNDQRFLSVGHRMTAAGDIWRQFAVVGSRICKGRASETENYAAMADILRDCAEKERIIYRELLDLTR